MDEVVKLMLEGPPSQNMKETHGLLEVPNFTFNVCPQFFYIQ